MSLQILLITTKIHTAHKPLHHIYFYTQKILPIKKAEEEAGEKDEIIEEKKTKEVAEKHQEIKNTEEIQMEDDKPRDAEDSSYKKAEKKKLNEVQNKTTKDIEDNKEGKPVEKKSMTVKVGKKEETPTEDKSPEQADKTNDLEKKKKIDETQQIQSGLEEKNPVKKKTATDVKAKTIETPITNELIADKSYEPSTNNALQPEAKEVRLKISLKKLYQRLFIEESTQISHKQSTQHQSLILTIVLNACLLVLQENTINKQHK